MRGDRISGRSLCASPFFLRMPPPRIGVASTVRYLARHLGGGSGANQWQRRLAECYAVCAASSSAPRPRDRILRQHGVPPEYGGGAFLRKVCLAAFTEAGTRTCLE